MKDHTVVFLLFALVLVAVFSVGISGDGFGSSDRSRRGGHIVFYDDFSSGHIDTSKWTHAVSADGVGKNRFQMYTPEAKNSYVKNGVLYIMPTLTVDTFGKDFLWNGTFDARKIYGTCTNHDCVRHGWNQIHPVMSAMVHTSAHIRYGRVEVVAQLPKGDWLWPAIWMMPTNPPTYGGWPSSGEIDIMEARCNRNLRYHNGTSLGIDTVQSTIHYGPKRADKMDHHEYYRLQDTTFGDDFHTYWLDWNQDYIKIGVDNATVVTDNTPPHGYFEGRGWTEPNPWLDGGKDAPFDAPFYLILNVAVGGNFFGAGPLKNYPYPKPWLGNDPQQMMAFWNASNLWYPTWQGEGAAMKVKSVKMVQY